MNLKLKVVLIGLLGLSFQTLFAQQDPQFTQYMFNTLGVNAAYAGSRGHLSATGLLRSQWVGLDGAPRTQTFSIESQTKVIIWNQGRRTIFRHRLHTRQCSKSRCFISK